MRISSRRRFLRDVSMGSAAAVVASRIQPFTAAQSAASPWRSRIGLELYTVRDRLTTDYEGTLAKVAAMGYTEVEPVGYNNMSPKDFRAMLDRHKLTMPSTHSAARGTGLELEKQLEGFQVMGIKYTEITAPPVQGAPPPPPDPRRPAGPLPPGGYFDAGTGYARSAQFQRRVQ